MTRRGVVAVALLGVLVAPVRAELKYTMKTEAHPSTVRSATPANPLFTMLSSLVLGMIAPPGGLVATFLVGDRGTRVEYNKAYTVVPAGGAMLMMPDGAVVVIDPATKTYSKIARTDTVSTLAGRAPEVNLRRTGTFASIAGVRAERATVDIRVALPVPAGMAMPGLPSDLALAGEAWFADQYKNYSQRSGGLTALGGSAGLEALSNAGFLMRAILRSELFGEQELESVVTEIGEAAVPASSFQIPAGYTEVPPQTPFGMGLPR